ncbi:MAG: sulfatase [Bacteroidales bacterium]
MKNKRIILGSISIAIICTCFLASCKEPKPDKKNVLFITIDDLTTRAISAYNPEGAKTPNIDKLASEATIFNRAYCQFPVCGPSRASFMFGYYPHATNTFGYTNGRENVGSRQSLAQLFKDEGYYTARVSKIFHMGIPIDIEKGSNGADDSLSWGERYNCKAPEWQLPGKAELVQNNPDGEIERKGGNVMTIVRGSGADLENADKQAANKACELIRAHKNEAFFLALGFVRPHVPWVAPSRYFDEYNYDSIQLPTKIKDDWSDIPQRGINYVTSTNGQMSIEQQKKAVAAYYSSVAFVDDMLGQVLETLKSEGLEDNTIVVLVSDHGFHLGEHDFWMKVSLHEESVKVPFIIKTPGKKPARCGELVELIDIYPTIAELAGIEYSHNIQGKSLVPTLDNANTGLRDFIFSTSLGGTSFLIEDKNWAYIQYGEDAQQGMELFDMNKDPKQYTNLAEDKNYADILAKYQQKLKNKLAEVRQNDLRSQELNNK